jgi:uncharacterized protein
MARRFAEIAFTPTVRAEQVRHGSRATYARWEGGKPADDPLGERERAFIEARDSFYLASVSETGWPYVQHRGGPRGFLRVLSDRTIGFADFSGNRQYVSVGNLRHDDRVALIMVDYASRTRLKILGRARFIDGADGTGLEPLTVPGYRAKVERGLLIEIAAFDWNCPQHITPRFTLDEVEELMAPLKARMAELEATIQLLRNRSG